MQEVFERIAHSIIDSFLKLQIGDCLSINTDERDFDFARIVANLAVERTCTVVKIVQTENGKPQEVIDFDPDITKASEPKGFVMLTLKHESEKISDKGKLLDVIVDKNDLRAIQKLGHLAEPIVLNRRISVPWATIPVYSPSDSRLNELMSLLDNDLEGTVLSSDYRRHYFNHADIDHVLVKGERTDFEFDIPENNLFSGGSCTVRNQRRFVPSIDFATFKSNVDCNSLNGCLHGNAVILGKECELDLEFKNGNLVKHSPCSQLERILSFDEKLSKIGYFSFSDKKFSVFLGGALTDCLEQSPESEDELPSWFNDSLYSIEIRLDSKLCASFVDCDGKKTELLRSGFIIE